MMATLTSAFVVAAEGPNGNWLPADIKEVWYGSAAFFIVMGLLAWKALPAIKQAMADRSASIAESLDDASAQRERAEAERASITTALADADTEAAHIVEEARTTADTIRREASARASEDATAIRERIPVEEAAARAQATSDLEAEVSRLALGAAEKVVAANLDDATQQALIDQYIARAGVSN